MSGIFSQWHTRFNNYHNLCRTFETTHEARQVLLLQQGCCRRMDPRDFAFRLLCHRDYLPDVQVRFRPVIESQSCSR